MDDALSYIVSDKEGIRFRLTPDRLTGYVIACDHPRADGTKLEPYLVDVFELGPRPAPPA